MTKSFRQIVNEYLPTIEIRYGEWNSDIKYEKRIGIKIKSKRLSKVVGTLLNKYVEAIYKDSWLWEFNIFALTNGIAINYQIQFINNNGIKFSEWHLIYLDDLIKAISEYDNLQEQIKKAIKDTINELEKYL